MSYIIFLISSYFGFIFHRSLSKNGHKINGKLPYIKVNFIQISPEIIIFIKGHKIHLHHWLTYTVVLIITMTSNAGFLDTVISKGILAGGIVQGLTFSDWRKIIYKKD